MKKKYFESKLSLFTETIYAVYKDKNNEHNKNET